MATPKGSLTCLLCNGAVSIKAGNLEKFKFHIESNHDVFYDQDILIAINFLEAHEKEVIIEKVLPRMKLLFENTVGNERIFPGHKRLNIEKRLLDADFQDELSKPSSKRVALSNMDDEDKIQYDDNLDVNSENSDGELSSKSSDVEKHALGKEQVLALGSRVKEDEFLDCEICKQSIRKSVFEIHSKSHLLTSLECDICGNVVQRKVLATHKRSCMSTKVQKDLDVNDVEMMAQSKSLKEFGDEDTYTRSVSKKESESTIECTICRKTISKGNIKRHIRMVHPDGGDFKCKICFTGFQDLDDLKEHTKKDHSLELEEIEEILQESNKDQHENTFQNPSKHESTMNTSAHHGSKKLKCDQCDNFYSSKESLRKHVKRYH